MAEWPVILRSGCTIWQRSVVFKVPVAVGKPPGDALPPTSYFLLPTSYLLSIDYVLLLLLLLQRHSLNRLHLESATRVADYTNLNQLTN